MGSSLPAVMTTVVLLLLLPLLHLLLYAPYGGEALDAYAIADLGITYVIYAIFNVTCLHEPYTSNFYLFRAFGANSTEIYHNFFPEGINTIRYEAVLKYYPLVGQRMMKPMYFIRFCHRCGIYLHNLCHVTIFQIPRRFIRLYSEVAQNRISYNFPEELSYRFVAELSNYDSIPYGCNIECIPLFENIPELPWELRVA